MNAAQGALTVGVIVVDDQLVFRQVAREVIAATPGFEMLGEATAGEHTLAVVEDLHPDLVLLDVRMQGMDGIHTAARLTEVHPEVVVVLVSVEEAPYMPGRLQPCGAADLLRKQDFGPAALCRVWERHRPPLRD